MVTKNFYFQIVVRIIFIVLTALAVAFLFFSEQYIFCLLMFGVLILQTVFLIRYINYTNRMIAYFFESVKNEDFTLRFSEEVTTKPLKELNKSLNGLNEMMQQIYLKNQAQERYYQEILKQADIGILTLNDNGHIIFSNPTVERLLNYKPLNHIKQLAQVDEELYGLFDGLQLFERKLFELTNERDRTQLAIKSTSITIDKQHLLLVVIQDIHKELDEKETDSWVRLIRVLTHEIMNTITPITSISESVLKYFKSNDEQVSIHEFSEDQVKNTVKGLEVIKQQGGDLMSFVQSYRTLLSVPKPDRSIVGAQNLLDKVKVLMDPDILNGSIKIDMIAHPEDLELFIDEKQITQVLVNLCKNALQSLKNQREGNIKVFARINSEGNKIIEVLDNGPGIPTDLIDEIFVPFFTTKDTGTGIGLSLSKQILRLHNGSLKVYSIPDRETSFVLTF